MKSTRVAQILVAIEILLCSICAAFADAYPARPIHIFTQFAPGGAVEATLRVIANELSGSEWPPVVVENRPGGGGMLAASEVKRAPADGYTLLLADIGSHAISPNLVPDPPYDPNKDFTPIVLMWSFPSVLVVPADSQARSVEQLVALAKSKTGGLNYASQGPGSGGQLLGAMFANDSGAEMTHVPYKGAGPALLDLIGNRVDLMFASYGSVRGAITSRQLRILAVTSKSRLIQLPDIPTMTEAGYPEVYLDAWFGLVGPAGLADTIVAKVNERVAAILRSPAVTKKLDEQAWNVTVGSGEEFRQLIAFDQRRLRNLIKKNNVS